MSKCGNRWTDPTEGKSEQPVGPYSCGRSTNHNGHHAWEGNGAVALWTKKGDLIFSIQHGRDKPPEQATDTASGGG